MRVTVGGTAYDLEVIDRSTTRAADAVAIVMPCHEAFELTRTSLEAIRRFTDVPHEVWVVDNASSKATVERLRSETDANLLLNRTAPWKRGGLLARFTPWYRSTGGGSIANGTALELAASVVTRRWMWVMHNDALPCKRGWLTFFRSKLSDRVRGAAAHHDPIRMHAMHQSGFLFDFSLFRQLHMSFLPNIPEYDAGDLVTIRLREAGYDVFIAENSTNRPELRRRLPESHWLKRIPGDIAFDDAGEIVYVHVGRGTLRYSRPRSRQAKQLSLDGWVGLVRTNVLGG